MRPALALALAGAFLAGPWTRSGLVVSGAVVLRRRADWLPALAREVLAVYPSPPLDAPRELAAVIATREVPDGLGRPRSRPVVATRMLRNPWHLPVLHGLEDVGRLLRLDAGELEWFADGRHLARGTSAGPLQHYRVGTRRSPSGAVRVLEAPKPRLKALQRLLLARVLHGVPPHDAAHGFRPGRSVATYAAPHAGRAVVLRMDLEGFFASVTVGRVYGLLRTAGYPEPVAHCLAGLLHDGAAPLGLGAGAPAGRPVAAGRALAARPAPGRTAPAAGRADVAGARQPRGAPARRPADGARGVVGRRLHALRRRPGAVGRARLGRAGRRGWSTRWPRSPRRRGSG